MTDQAIAILSGSLNQLWRFFNSWNIPGTNVTPAELGFFFLFVRVAFAVIGHIFNNPRDIPTGNAPDPRDERFDMPPVERSGLPYQPRKWW